MMQLLIVACLLLFGVLSTAGALAVRSYTRTHKNEKYAGLVGVARMRAAGSRNGRASDAGFVDVSSALSLAVLVAVVIVGAVVALQVLSNLFPTYAGAVANLSTNMSTANWGNTTANSLGPIFGLLISLAGIFAVLGLVFIAVEVRHLFGGGGGGKA